MNEIKVGDYFRKKGESDVYKAMYVKDDYVSGDTMVSTAKAFPQTEVELIDPKTAFLTELKELLEKYDASIYAGGYDADGIGLNIGSDNVYYTTNYNFGDYITASNIMDFDKE